MPAAPNVHDWVGYAAALLTTASFVPQAALTLRTRDTSGVSLPMYLLFTCGVALWLAYGVLLRAWPVIAANAITLALACIILVATWRNRRGPPPPHPPPP
jgi:MtN3 and saliva related transmembrane protein